MIPRWLSIEWFIEFNEILKHLMKHGVRSVLDVGCGAGTLCRLLEMLDIRCIGIDIDCSRARCECIEHDIRKPLPFNDDSFDAVVSQHVIEHIEREYQLLALKEMVRVARKIVVVLTPNARFEAKVEDVTETEGGPHKHVLTTEEARWLCKDIPNCSVYEMDSFFYASADYRRAALYFYNNVYRYHPKPTIVILIEKRTESAC